MMTTETDQFYMCRGAPVPLHANFCAIGIRRELWKPAQLLESVNESIVLLNEPDHLLPQTIIKKKNREFPQKVDSMISHECKC